MDRSAARPRPARAVAGGERVRARLPGRGRRVLLRDHDDDTDTDDCTERHRQHDDQHDHPPLRRHRRRTGRAAPTGGRAAAGCGFPAGARAVRRAADGRPEFDRLFRVRTDHPDLARSVLGPALVGEHLAGTVPFWDLAGHDLLTWEPGRIDDPRWIPARTDALVRVAMVLGR